EPGPGDRQVEKDVIVDRHWRGEGLAESLLSFGRLLVDELATDLVLFRQVRDGRASRQGLKGQLLPLSRCQRLGGAECTKLLLPERPGLGRIDAHVCVL